MRYIVRSVSSLKASVPEVWSTLLQAPTFLVPPHANLSVRVDRNANLVSGKSVLARFAAGPIPLFGGWVVETHDRDDMRSRVKGAEGFEDQLLWDYEALIGEDGPRTIVEFRAKVPRRSIGAAERLFERRYINLRSKIHQALEARGRLLRQLPTPLLGPPARQEAQQIAW